VATETELRNNLERLMKATLTDERLHHDWDYDAVRPLPVPGSWHSGQHVKADCSFGVKLLCFWADVPDDPTGYNYKPYGNSSSIWAHLDKVSVPAHLEVGDIVVFGYDGSDHAAMVLEAGQDPLLWSHGHQGAPNTYRLSYDRRTKYFCKLNLPPDKVTAQDKLRAKTGMWAWFAWKLGEGPWRHYGKSNGKVRPDVPKRIPLKWWRAYAKFLANRKLGDKPTTA
jgi:hypothetical protein